VPLRDLRHHRARRQRFFDDPHLIVARPATTTLNTAQNLYPHLPTLRLALKLDPRRIPRTEQGGLRRRNTDPHAGDLYIFRGRRGDLAKILWHDGIGLSLYAKRLDRGKFIWPSASSGAISISAAQMAYMLEGIDWRNPQLTWRPQSAG
jgi:transposase